MKKSAGRMFIRGFVKSFFILAILLGVGAISYQAVMNEWNVTEKEAVVAFEAKEPESIIVASLDDVSKNLIYSYDEKTGKINKLVLEIFHCENKEIHYITIPIRTQYTMSDTLYRKLVTVHPAIPQMIKLSNIPKYFDRSDIFDYGVLIIEDLLETKISYYTAIPEKHFNKIFMSAEDDSINASDNKSVPIVVFQKDYIKMIKTLDTKEEVRTYIEENYSLIKSNLTVSEKMNYLDSYLNVELDNVSFGLIEGKDSNSAYVIDSERAFRQLAQYLAQTKDE